jgi:hypothetical protein
MAFTDRGLDGLLSSTIDHFMPSFEDNIMSSKPLLWALKNAGRIKSFTGTGIVVPLMYAEAANHGTYADDDVFGTAANAGLGSARYAWRQYYGLVHFTGIELAQNSGKQALISLLEARMEQVQLTVAENLDELLWTGSDTSPSWLGIAKAVGTTDRTVGEIDSTTYTWWDSQLDATSEAVSLTRMRTLYNSASEGNDHPSNIFTTMEGFESYEDLIDDNARFLDPTTADAGFQNLMFKGAPITFDKYVPDGDMYFLNLKYVTLAKLNDVWFSPSEFLRPTNADVQYKHIRCYGNLVFSNLSRQGASTALTDA